MSQNLHLETVWNKPEKPFSSVQSAGVKKKKKNHKSTAKPEQVASPEFFLKCVLISKEQNFFLTQNRELVCLTPPQGFCV